jgi:hypothetical protein
MSGQKAFNIKWRYSMKQTVVFMLLIAAVVSLAVGCGGGANDPVNKIYGYYDKVLSILEQNKADPQKAGTEIQTYYKSIEQDMTGAVTALKGNPLKIAELGMKIVPLLQRQQKLIQENGALAQSMGGFDVSNIVGAGAGGK